MMDIVDLMDQAATHEEVMAIAPAFLEEVEIEMDAASDSTGDSLAMCQDNLKTMLPGMQKLIKTLREQH